MIRFFCFFFALAAVASGADRDALVGTWKIVTFHDDSRDRLERLGAGPVKKDREPRFAKLVFTADDCYVLRGDGRREMASGLSNAGWKRLTLDESAAPKTADIVGYAGKENEKEKIYPAIYKLEGDRLTICWSEQGKTRPEKFESDGANNLFICERLSTDPLPLPSE